MRTFPRLVFFAALFFACVSFGQTDSFAPPYLVSVTNSPTVHVVQDFNREVYFVGWGFYHGSIFAASLFAVAWVVRALNVGGRWDAGGD